MNSLLDYPSSSDSEDVVDTTASNRPTHQVLCNERPAKRTRCVPARDIKSSLKSDTLRAAGSQQTQTLPPVLALSGDHAPTRFLLHVRIPVVSPISSSSSESCPVRDFLRVLEARTRLRMVGQPVKASLNAVVHDLHISLSRPTLVPQDDVHAILSALRTAISTVPFARVCVANDIIALPGGNGRKLFFAAPVVRDPYSPGHHNSSGASNLALVLIQKINNVFRSFNLPTHFAQPKPHLSFAWTDSLDVSPLFYCNGKQTSASLAPLPDSSISTRMSTLVLNVSSVVCSVGKVSHRLPLRDPESKPRRSMKAYKREPTLI